MTVEKLWGSLSRDALLTEYPRLDSETREHMVAALRDRLPTDRVLYSADQLIAYSYDATGERHRPDVVVLPHTRDEVVAAVKVADEFGSYVIARGAGTNLSGGTTPIAGGLVISLAHMNKIRRIDYDNRYAIVEPGVVNGVLQDTLRPQGFFYPPDPSSHRISTLGGNIAENSGGPHCVKYGVTTNHIIDLEIVTVHGDVVRLPATRDWRSGYDLVGLLTGSEGTMGLVTELTVVISPLPERVQTMLAVFSTISQALRCVSAIIAAKVVPSTLELLDKVSIEIVESFVHAGYPAGAEAVLLIEVDGSPHAVEEQTQRVHAVAEANGAVEFRLATTDAEAEALWRGRRAHYGAAARIAPHLWVQDVTVPRPLLADMMKEVLELGNRYHFPILTVSHAGDGNLHPTIPYDPTNADEVSRMHEVDQEILKACVRFGGAITGEHGIGVDKVENLSLMYSNQEIGVMWRLKEVFDPDHRLNPAKAIPVLSPSLKQDSPWVKPLSLHRLSLVEPDSAEMVANIVVAAHAENQHLLVRGTGLRSGYAPNEMTVVSTAKLTKVIDFDPDNLTCEVEAGMIAGELSSLLTESKLELGGVTPFHKETIGGLVASNARFWHQGFGLGWRDMVAGVEWVDGRGQILRFGRKTMKNVAGFDVTKLAVGSWGTLGVITKLILRLRPRVTPRRVGVAEGEVQELLRYALQLGKLSSRPQGVIVERYNGHGRLVLLAQGVEADVIQKGTENIVGRATVDWSDDEAKWSTIEEHRMDLFYQAIRTGCYQEGGVELSKLCRVADQISPDVGATFFPCSGAYEIYGAAGMLPGATKRFRKTDWDFESTDGLKNLQQGIHAVFDPASLFLEL